MSPRLAPGITRTDPSGNAMTELPQSVFHQRAKPASGGRSFANVGQSQIFDAGKLLGSVGLRPTRHRLALVAILFGDGGRHLTAEMLFEETLAARIPVSLATVYNTLNCLSEAGLLRQVCVGGGKTYFDTNVSGHQHFYNEDGHELIDIPDSGSFASNLPNVPDEYEVSRVEIIVRIRKKRRPEI
jgi:Fur family iron response transcriptional regulator